MVRSTQQRYMLGDDACQADLIRQNTKHAALALQDLSETALPVVTT